ncbi:hypothetical protein MG293_014024 [Ovis ammon polii]|uniref:Uncharacterized protein n=1 Tax=Ovis ammon polii TaxID=230172 RepID=A0AAD4TWT9_OVIAM|nr:hypothetical protein MG293_014024 [Ovis ammon polii]
MVDHYKAIRRAYKERKPTETPKKKQKKPSVNSQMLSRTTKRLESGALPSRRGEGGPGPRRALLRAASRSRLIYLDLASDQVQLCIREKLNMFKCSFFFKSSACGDQGLGVMLDILHAYRHLEVELQTESKLEMKHRVRNPWTKEAPTSDSHSHPVTPSHVLLFRPDREAHEPATNTRLFTASVD